MQPEEAELYAIATKRPTDKMKILLVVASALSLILMVSAQCDPNAVLSCSQDYARMVSNLTC